jgi:uncharacterized protein DUF5069
MDELKKWARDLRKEEPRPSGEMLGGFPLGARCLDICRALLLGWQGNYQYECQMNQEFLQAARIDSEEFKEYVATGASDSQIDRWIRLHAHAHG